MKFMIIIVSVLAFCAGYEYCDAQRPVEYKPVTVTVTDGDTLGAIAWRLKRDYNDTRDWRVIASQAKEDNSLGRYIYPGQKIVVKVEVKK